MGKRNNFQTPESGSDSTNNFSQPTGGGSKTLITVLIAVIVVLVAGLIWQMYAAGEFRQEVEEMREELDEMREVKAEMEQELEEPEVPEEYETYLNEEYGFALDYPSEKLTPNEINLDNLPPKARDGVHWGELSGKSEYEGNRVEYVARIKLFVYDNPENLSAKEWRQQQDRVEDMGDRTPDEFPYEISPDWESVNVSVNDYDVVKYVAPIPPGASGSDNKLISWDNYILRFRYTQFPFIEEKHDHLAMIRSMIKSLRPIE